MSTVTTLTAEAGQAVPDPDLAPGRGPAGDESGRWALALLGAVLAGGGSIAAAAWSLQTFPEREARSVFDALAFTVAGILSTLCLLPVLRRLHSFVSRRAEATAVLASVAICSLLILRNGFCQFCGWDTGGLCELAYRQALGQVVNVDFPLHMPYSFHLGAKLAFQWFGVWFGAFVLFFADISCRLPYPNYVRLDRKPLPALYKPGHDFSPGLHVFAPPGDICLLATGNMVHRALDVAEELRGHGVRAGVVDVYTLPINAEALLPLVRATNMLFTFEEHSLPGGFGSAVCETLCDAGVAMPVKRFGLDLRCGYCYRYGGREHLQSLYGLDQKALVGSILDCLKRSAVPMQFVSAGGG